MMGLHIGPESRSDPSGVARGGSALNLFHVADCLGFLERHTADKNDPSDPDIHGILDQQKPFGHEVGLVHRSLVQDSRLPGGPTKCTAEGRTQASEGQ
jgi:hypothetical protein